MRDVPPPVLPDNGILVSVVASVVSSGTEAAKLEVGAKSLLSKARSRPDAVQQTLETIRREGIRSAASLVKARLDTPQEIGYSCAGVVEEVGRYGGPIRPGQRAACSGGGYANHASVVAVPRNLITPVPDRVTDEQAAYATVGAIALHGLRQAECGLGDRVLVIGLGLIGQLTCQLASAAGAMTHGIDLSQEKARMAAKVTEAVTGTSLEELESAVDHRCDDFFDIVIVTAASKSNEPIEMAAQAVRDRGRVVVVGDVGLDLDRRPFYEKEVELRFSRSYGPGRYDPVYEQLGVDYPSSYVRWTVQRNMEGFLEMCAAGRVDPEALTTHRFPIDDAALAYETVSNVGQFSVGVLLTYPPESRQESISVRAAESKPRAKAGLLRVGMVGAGRFATRQLLPILGSHPRAKLTAVASERGLSSERAAERYDAEAVEGLEAMISSGMVDAVVIATRHDSHARLTRQALDAGLHVLVEKPLTRVEEELEDVLSSYDETQAVCMVGFNRRYAPSTRAVVAEMASLPGPAQILIRVNAGRLDDHWLADPDIGGGRLVGEGCHFVDLAAVLVGMPASGVVSTGIPARNEGPSGWQDFSLGLDYPNGSAATILYSSLGDPKLPKERVEAHKAGISAVIDDFRSWQIWRGGNRAKGGGRTIDKGHQAELDAFLDACVGARAEPVSFVDDVASTVTTFAALRSLGSARRVEVPKLSIDA